MSTRKRFEIPVIEDKQLIVGKLRWRDVRCAIHFEMSRPQSLQKMIFRSRRILGQKEDARLPQSDRMFEWSLAEACAFKDAGKIDGACRVQAGEDAHDIAACFQRHITRSDALAFRHQLDGTLGSLRGADDEIDGELLSRKRDRRSECRFNAQQRLRTTRKRERIDGDVQFAGKPGSARNTSLILVSVGDESDTRRHTAGQTGDRVSDRRLDVCTAPGIAGAVL